MSKEEKVELSQNLEVSRRHLRSKSQVLLDEFKDGLLKRAQDGIISQAELEKFLGLQMHYESVVQYSEKRRILWKKFAVYAFVSSLFLLVAIWALVVAGIEYLEEARPDGNAGYDHSVSSLLVSTNQRSVVGISEASYGIRLHDIYDLVDQPEVLLEIKVLSLPTLVSLEEMPVTWISVESNKLTFYGPTASTYLILRDNDSALFVHDGVTTEIPPDTIDDDDEEDDEFDVDINGYKTNRNRLLSRSTPRTKHLFKQLNVTLDLSFDSETCNDISLKTGGCTTVCTAYDDACPQVSGGALVKAATA